MSKLSSALILSIALSVQLVNCHHIVRRDSGGSSSTSLQDENIIKRYVVSPNFGTDPFQNEEYQRVVRQSTYSSPQTTYTSSSSGSVSSSQPVYTTYVSNPSSPAAAPSSGGSGGSPLDGLASLLSLGSGTGGGALGGVIETASGGVKTVLEIKRDVIIPLVLGILNFIKNIATSETLQTIANVKLGAARTALSVGPSFIQALSGIAATAGDITSTLINIFLCNIICPLQSDPNSCSTQASCASGSGSGGPTKTTYSSPASSSYIISR